MQTVVSFIQGNKIGWSAVTNATPIQDQVNDYLRQNPSHSIRTMSTLLGPSYVEAFVVFDIREEKSSGQKQGQNQNQNRGQIQTPSQKQKYKQSEMTTATNEHNISTISTSHKITEENHHDK